MNLYEDRISDFLDGCFRAGIKDPLRFMEQKRIMVFDWLRGAFPRDIIPTDIDGEVEINGRFLRLEFKHEDALRAGRVSRGQRIALERLTRTGAFTVFIVGMSECGEPTCFEMFKSDGSFSKLTTTSREDMRAKCKAWADWAEKQPRWCKPAAQEAA